MAGSKIGGLKARDTNVNKYGADFYKHIGSLGGKAGRTGGFYADRDLARRAGHIGGQRSSRAGVPNGYNKRRMAAEAAQA